VTFWVVQLAFAGTGTAPTVPPQLIFEIRPSAVGISDLALQGETNFETFEDRGQLAQASGVLCSQWELWMQIHPGEPSGSKLRIQMAGAADRRGDGEFYPRFGLLAFALT
jgi:hypothetical protein